MSDDDFEQEYSTPTTTTMTGTPRPGMDTEDEAELRLAAANAIWAFSQAAKASAVKSKRRRSLNSRTFYRMSASHQVKRALESLEKTQKMNPADFQFLKKAIGGYRVRLTVHDSKTFGELNELQANIKQQEDAAEVATRTAFNNKEADAQVYIDAKDKYLDLKAWNAELTKEIRLCQPKPKYASMGGGLFRNTAATAPEPPGVPSQHAQISPSAGNVLRNILSPETLRRTFISLKGLTQKISEEVATFLTDDQRQKDRADVVKQIKESLAAAAAAEKAKKLSQKNSN